MASQHIEADQPIELPAIWPVTCHTDHVGPGSTFVAIKGKQQDGVDFISVALAKGATTIVLADSAQLTEQDLQTIKEHDVTVQRVENTRKALALLSAQAYGFPAHKLTILGITGTKGKTTTAYLVHHILSSAGFKTALISTVENKIEQQIYPASLTTPQPDYLHMFMHACVKQGVTHLVIETAAQAFSLHRLEGILFDVGIFTNFAHEHLEFYETMSHYFQAKCQLFKQLKPKAIKIINADDQHCAQLIDQHPEQLLFYLNELEDISVVPSVSFMYRKQLIEAPYLMGRFNAYNMLAALHAAESLGIDLMVIAQAMRSFKGVKGRLQRHSLANGATCYVDYAHTPDSYEQVLSLLKSQTDDLIVVFGCGGARDASKRPLMGAVAERYADHIILTSDNPRHEDPQQIIADITQGIAAQQKMHIELDRALAIRQAYALSTGNSIIAILGKGPDEFQCIGTIKHFFSDTQIVQQLY